MRTTRRSRRDRVGAALVALGFNGLIAWALQVQLSTHALPVQDEASTQVLFIAAAPRPGLRVVPVPRPVAAPTSRAPDPPRPVRARPVATTEPATPIAPIASARPMSAVYLQQARQWARQEAAAPSAGNDALAEPHTDLPGRPTEHFRMPEPMSVAIVVDRIGQAFGNGPHPCIRNRQDVAAYATGGDALALQMALDTERRCRP